MVRFSQTHSLPGFQKTDYKYEIANDITYDRVQSLRELTGLVDQHTLYVAEQTWTHDSFGSIPLALVIICKEFPMKKPDANVDILYIKAELSADELVYSLTQSIAAMNRFVDANAALYEALILGKNLQYIVDVATNLLQNPLVVGDSDFKIIAHSKDHGQVHDFWRASMNQPYCTYKEYQKDRTMILKAINSETPIIDRVSSKQGAIIGVGLGTNNNKIGHLSVFECDKPIDDVDVQITATLQKVLSFYLKYTSNNTDIVENGVLLLLLREVFQTDIIDDATRKTLEKELKFHQMPFHFMLKVGGDKKIYRNIPTSIFIPIMESHLRECRCVADGNYLLVFLARKSNTLFLPEELKWIELFLTENSLCIGMSNPFRAVSDLKRANYQASHALNLGLKYCASKRIFNYIDLMPLHLIQEAADNCSLLDICDPRINNLVLYDYNNKTEYLQTLYCLLHNNMDSAITAKELCIHRNSLYYRMQKIEDLIGIRFKEATGILQISITMEILHYLIGKEPISAEILISIMGLDNE